MEQVEKVFKGYEDYLNGVYYSDVQVAENAIRSLFASIQMAKGESDGEGIRIRKRFVDCTVEGMIYEYGNRGRKATAIHRTYDTVVKLTGQDEVNYQSALYWRPD